MPQLARTLKAICVAPTESNMVFTYMYNVRITFYDLFNHKVANCKLLNNIAKIPEASS